MENIKPRFYLFDFCCGELVVEDDFETSSELDIYLQRHYVEDPVVIYGYNITRRFFKCNH